MIYSALPTVLIVSCMAQLIQAQSNGDVRLVKGNFSYEWTGRLEIYLDGEWGTFCANGFNTFAGDAACRQLGYDGSIGKISRASDYVNYISLASNSTPIHLSNHYNQCSDYSCNGPVHILRCFPEGFDKMPDPTCTHSNDTILSCYSLPLYYDGYDTQLFLNSKALNSTYQSSGVLEIYSSSEACEFNGWSNICGTNFDQNAANSACRQLGYTGALSYNTSAHRSSDNGIWLDGVTCGEYAGNCLDMCFCYTQPPIAVQCDPNNVVALTCTFNMNEALLNDAGSRTACEENEKRFCAPTVTVGAPTSAPDVLIITGTVLSAVIVLLSVVIVGLVCYIIIRRQSGYQTIN